MTLVRITTSEALPISLIEAKALARLDGQEDDALIAGYLRTASEATEQYLGRALLTSTWEYRPAHFLWSWCTASIRLPLAPVQSVDEMRYVDPTGAEQVLDPVLYLVTGLPDAAAVSHARGAAWPAMAHQPEALAILFTAGYGDSWNSVPEPIRTALGEQVRGYYDGCGNGMVEQLLQPYRRVVV